MNIDFFIDLFYLKIDKWSQVAMRSENTENDN